MPVDIIDSAAERVKNDLGVPTKMHARDPGTLRPTIIRLLAWHFPDRQNLDVGKIEAPSGAGVNNETLLLDVSWTEDGALRNAGYVLRLDTADNLFFEPYFPHHFQLYQVMGALRTIPVPLVFGLETNSGILGRPFFFMERIEGIVPSDQPPFHHAGWVAEKSPKQREAMWRDAVATMVRLHETDVSKVEFLARPARGASGFEQELHAAFEYCDDALGGERHDIIEAARDWLAAHLPAKPATGLAWGDARPQNLMFRDERVVALFDWDMASLAGPETDLAWWTIMDLSMTHSRGIPRLEGWGSPAETIALWEQLSGRKPRDIEYHFVFAAFRSAIIVRRLARMLDAKGQLPEHSASWIDNNIGIQYLASMLSLPPHSADSQAWPGIK